MKFDPHVAVVNAFLEVDSAELSSEDQPENPVQKFVVEATERQLAPGFPQRTHSDAQIQKAYAQAVESCAARMILYLKDELTEKGFPED
jgi:hypothetical protein